MFFKLLKAEKMKLRHSPVWIAFLILPVIPAILGTANYLCNIEILKKEWYSLWTQHTLFTCYFFLPILIGIFCSYLMHIEYTEGNLNKLLTMPVLGRTVFLSKLTVASVMVLISETEIGLLFAVSGKIAGIVSPFPLKSVLLWCGLGTLGGMAVVSVQLLLSVFIKSFAAPVALSLIGGISGLAFLAKDLGDMWIYSLVDYGMNANSPQQLTENGYIPFIAVCVFYIAIFTAAGSFAFSHKDR